MNRIQRKAWDTLMKAWEEGKTACHLHFARKYVSTYPDDMYGWIALADVLAGIALYEDAKKSLQKSLKLCSPEKKHQVYVQLGHMYNQKCDLKRAEKWYRQAIEAYSKQEYFVFLGVCLAKQGRLKEAKALHQRAVRIQPEAADEAYLNLGLIYRAEGNNKKALVYLDRAIKIDPNYEIAKSELQDLKELITIKKKR